MRLLPNMRGYELALGACIALAFCVLCTMPLRAQDEEQSITLAEYRTDLAAAIDALENVTDADAAPVLAAWQEHFAAITRIEYPGGQEVTVTSLLDNLDTNTGTTSTPDDSTGDDANVDATATPDPAAPSPRRVALARLHGAAAQIDAMPTDDTDNRRLLLDEVLARPEFNTPLTLWERFWRWFTRWLEELLPSGGSSRGAGLLAWLIELVPWIVAFVILAAIIWLLSYWLQRILRSFVTDARLAKLAEDGDMPATAAEARQQARSAAQSGNYRDAVRRLYLAALLQLAEHDLITYERSLTNREVLVRVPPDSPIRPHLEPVIATFDQVWYGVREPDLATFHAYEQEIDELAAVARRTMPSPAPTSQTGAP